MQAPLALVTLSLADRCPNAVTEVGSIVEDVLLKM